ncbi:cytidylyltransferase domain-containing protein [Thermospira aquatica]|uniref:Acylneuraminate cytidylyltransferase n=1 Tax=Thermospira aquatica TaxID=2828656 RepID=A0AAX3BBJ4_9SPIR|nr:hypothetical protein [Thermospira aquatica]URA09642.1 hypothetical protein KDW03_09130 [Thermospira aquatica]
MRKIDVILQARLDSERLPRKVLALIEGKPLIAHIVERLRLSQYARRIIVATTADSYPALHEALKPYPEVHFFIGSKPNVLERYYMAMMFFESDIVVRATGDNPLVSPEFMDMAIEYHMESSADLTHYLGIPLGTGVEVISRSAIETAYKNAKTDYEKEHVTPFLYKNRDSFSILEPVSTGFYYAPEIRVTVDTYEDLQRVREAFAYYRGKPFISMEDIIRYFIRKESEEAHLALARASM